MTELLRRKVKQRLFELTPRAFEFFAGDLLEYLGLASVVVTKQSGDGGIDAHCEIASGGIFRVPAGVQVKRYQHSVTRPDMDRFIGALANRYSCGIFITTSSFTKNALQKASLIPHISTVDGEQITTILMANGVGILPSHERIDEGYFGGFEHQVKIKKQSVGYDASATHEVTAADDLISLRALSYVLRVDTTTIRHWIQHRGLRPDTGEATDTRSGLFFRRSRIDEIRQQFGVRGTPTLDQDWLAGFLHFAMHGPLNMSYKPVMLLAMLDLASEDGAVKAPQLVERFWAFYITRYEAGVRSEVDKSRLSRPTAMSFAEVQNLLLKNPLDRFLIQGYMEHQPAEGMIRFRPQVWDGLRYRNVLELRYALQRQIERYFARLDRTAPTDTQE